MNYSADPVTEKCGQSVIIHYIDSVVRSEISSVSGARTMSSSKT